MYASDVRAAPLLGATELSTRQSATIPGSWLIGGLAFSSVGVTLMVATAGQTITFTALSAVLLFGAAAIVIGLCCCLNTPRTENERIARDGAESIGLFALLCLLGAVASYPVAAHSSGFFDPALARIDRLLRFNWLDWYAVVAARPALQMLGTAAYASIFVTPALLLGYFACANRKADARRFIAAFWLAAMTTLVLFYWFPAKGPLAALWHGPIPYMPVSSLYQAEMIPALRSHALTVINLGELRGLVCAPSFHTSCAILYIAAAWQIPRLRWPVTAINGAMLLATPVEGTHYLADMLFGVIVATGALAVVTAMVRALPADDSRQPA